MIQTIKHLKLCFKFFSFTIIFAPKSCSSLQNLKEQSKGLVPWFAAQLCRISSSTTALVRRVGSTMIRKLKSRSTSVQCLRALSSELPVGRVLTEGSKYESGWWMDPLRQCGHALRDDAVSYNRKSFQPQLWSLSPVLVFEYKCCWCLKRFYAISTPKYSQKTKIMDSK